MANLKAAIRELPCIVIFDNDDLRTPFRKVAAFENGQMVFQKSLPKWLTAPLRGKKVP